MMLIEKCILGLLLLFITIGSAQTAVNTYFINVGQGDSQYIELPNGKTVLIDGGPSASENSAIVSFLKKRNIKTIDYLVLTHPHKDHYEGLNYVFDNLQVNNFYDTRVINISKITFKPSKGAVEIRQKALREPNCKIFYPRAGEKLDWSQAVNINVLHSCPDEFKTKDNDVVNNCSIVIKLNYNNIGILFAGDVQLEGISEMLSLYSDLLPSKILKVSHHGSKNATNAQFLEKVMPEIAIIEVGRNIYGHPTEEVLQLLEDINAIIYRTDIDGTIKYTID